MTTFDTENARKANKPYWWVDIEGLPTRYGMLNAGDDAEFDAFGGKTFGTHLASVPAIGGQTADPVNGSCSVPQHSFSLHDKDGDITELISVSDTPFDRTYLTGPISATDTFVPVEDYSDFASSGTIFIDRETIVYSGKTTNSSNTNTPSATIATGLTATGGTASSITDTAFPSVSDNTEFGRYIGCTLTCTGGGGHTNSGEVRTITGFSYDDVSGVGTYTWKTPMAAACDATTEYSLSSPTNEIKCAALTQVDDYWNGAIVEFTAGTNSGLVRWVYDFDATNDVVTLSEHLPEPVDATTRFNIVRYRLDVTTRGAHGSTASAHSVLDENGAVVRRNVSTKVPFVKTREVTIYENRIGCAESEAIKTRGWIDDYRLDPNGRTYTFSCSGLMKALARQLVAKQPTTQINELPLWGGEYNLSDLHEYASTAGGGSGYSSESSYAWHYQFILGDGTSDAFTVNRICVDSTDEFPDSGNVRIDDELIHYDNKEDLAINESTTSQALFLGGSASLDMNEQDSSQKSYPQDVARTMSCTHNRSMMAELLNKYELPPDWYSGPGAAAVGVKTRELGAETPEPIVLGAFIQEHKINADVRLACICTSADYSDFPRYDSIDYDTLAGGTFAVGDTITGGTSGATATVISTETTDPGRLIVIETVGTFQDAEAITCGGVSASIDEYNDEIRPRNNAIDAVLQLLMSSGTQGANGAYDTLPEGFGLGLSSDYVDVTAIETLRDKYFGSCVVDFALSEETSAKDFMEENIFRLLQVFPFETYDGKISLAYLPTYEEARIENSISALTALDSDHLSAKMLPDWTSGKPPISKIKIRCNKHPCKDKYASDVNVFFESSNEWYKDIGRTVELELSTLYMSDRAMKRVDHKSPKVPATIKRFIATLWDRLALYPCPIVSVTCPYSDIKVNVGDSVTLTHEDLPNLRTSQRGLTTEFFQVVGRTPDPTSGTVNLTLWQIGVHDNKYGRRTPSGAVSAYADDGAGAGKGRITLKDRVYSKYGESDVDYFSVGDKIMVLASDYDELTSPPEVLTIEAIDTTNKYLDLDGNFTTDPTAGCIVGDQRTAGGVGIHGRRRSHYWRWQRFCFQVSVAGAERISCHHIQLWT